MGAPGGWVAAFLTLLKVFLLALAFTKHRKLRRAVNSIPRSPNHRTLTVLLMMLYLYLAVVVITQVLVWVGFAHDWWAVWLLLLVPLVIPVAFFTLLCFTPLDEEDEVVEDVFSDSYHKKPTPEGVPSTNAPQPHVAVCGMPTPAVPPAVPTDWLAMRHQQDRTGVLYKTVSHEPERECKIPAQGHGDVIVCMENNVFQPRTSSAHPVFPYAGMYYSHPGTQATTPRNMQVVSPTFGSPRDVGYSGSGVRSPVFYT